MKEKKIKVFILCSSRQEPSKNSASSFVLNLGFYYEHFHTDLKCRHIPSQFWWYFSNKYSAQQRWKIFIASKESAPNAMWTLVILESTSFYQYCLSFVSLLLIRITLIWMRIRIHLLLVTLSGSYLSLWCGSGSWLPNKGSKPWKSTQIGSYSIQFGSSSTNWWGSESGSSLSL
jgi:hypothetical protein